MGFVGDMLGATNKTKAQGQTVQSGVQDYQTVKKRDLRTDINQEKVKFGQANLQNPFNAGTVQGTQGQINNSMAQQQAFTNAMAGQGGLGNQSSVFSQQQGLANQLGQQAAGGGPNPALAQLSQATSNNIKNQAALMASQRGAGQNAGLLAKQAAEQGVAAQQQAAGQASVMRAQQQLAAQQQLQAQQSQMAQLATQQVGQQQQGVNAMGQLALGNQQQVLGMLASQNQAQLAQQQGLNQLQLAQAQGFNNTNAQMAQQQNSIAAQMAMQGSAIGSANAQATAQNNMMAQGINAQVAGQNAQTNAAIAGGILGAGGTYMAKGSAGGAAAAAAHGGMIQKFANGGAAWGGAPTLDYNPNAFSSALSSNFKMPKEAGGPASSLGQKTKSQADSGGGTWFPQRFSSGEDNSYSAPLAIKHELPAVPNAINSGVGPTPAPMPLVAHGGQINVGAKLKSGGHVPGKAKVSGDSLKNDDVKALLSPGEIVIPRSITKSKDAPKKAAEFVASILARKGK